MSHDSTSKPVPPVPPVAGQTDGRRRRFLGAGVAATPAVLSLASQPALGVTCFTPSRSLSKNTSISQQGKYGECTNAESPGNYKAQQTPGVGAYHWPASVPPSTPFHPTFVRGSIDGATLFIINAPDPRSMTMGEVLDRTGDQDPYKVAFHLIAAYLNIKGGNGAVISPAAATETTITTIWSEWVTKGYYEPFAGTRWGSEQIKTYLISNGIVA